MTIPHKHLRSTLATVIAVGLILGCTQGGSLTPAEQDEAEMAVAQVARSWESAWTASDITTLVSLYSEDATIVNREGEDYRGIANLQAFFQSLFAGDVTYTGTTISPSEVVILGDYAFSNGTASATRHQGDQALAMSWKYMNLLQHQADGSWRIRKSIAVQTDPPLVVAAPTAAVAQ